MNHYCDCLWPLMLLWPSWLTKALTRRLPTDLKTIWTIFNLKLISDYTTNLIRCPTTTIEILLRINHMGSYNIRSSKNWRFQKTSSLQNLATTRKPREELIKITKRNIWTKPFHISLHLRTTIRSQPDSLLKINCITFSQTSNKETYFQTAIKSPRS